MIKELGFLLSFFLMSAHVWALDISQKDFCLQFNSGTGEKAVRTELLTRRIKVEEGINPHLLGVLVGIFREYQFYGPLQIKLDSSSGPRKAWVTGSGSEKTLWLAKNASDLILGQEIQKVVDKVCDLTLTTTHELSISWTNTVYEQVLRQLIDPSTIIRRFEQVSGWKIGSPSSDPESNLEQPFRDEEVVTVMKQFIDLPHEVLAAFHLKYIARAKVGRDVDKAAGVYYPAKKKILLTDGAFFDGTDIYGEGTLLHEFGHAWWEGQSLSLREKFTRISWQRDGDSWIKKEAGIKGFVSRYASTKPEDDFAETFSAYIHEPEKLFDLSSEKFLFFRQYVFKDVTYFSTVAANAKVFIDSQTTDKKPPFLDDKVRNCLSFSSQLPPSPPDTLIVQARLGCVWDMMSGPDNMLLSLEHEHESDSRILIPIKPLPDRKLGEPWVLTGEVSVKLSKLIKGRYHVKTVALEDKAGNRDFISAPDGPYLVVDGGMGTQQLAKPSIDWSRFKLEPAEPVMGHPQYIATIPIEHRETLESIHLTWFHEGTQERSVHVIGNRYRTVQILSKPGDPEIKVSIGFHKEHYVGKISLTSMTVFYEGSQTTRKYDDQHVVGNTDQAPYHMGSNPVDFRPTLDVNQMQLSAVEGENREGGKWSIRMKIPLERNPETEFSLHIRVRSPSGSNLGFVIPESLLTRYSSRYAQEGGRYWLEAVLPLKIHPERGNYIFESIEASTAPKQTYGTPANLDQIKFIRREKLLERGIKKEFRITPSDKLDLM